MIATQKICRQCLFKHKKQYSLNLKSKNMKTFYSKIVSFAVVALALVATSCSDDLAAVDPIAVDNLSGDRTITFTATVEADTRGYASISLFDYYRIYAYNTVKGLFIDGAEMKFADNEWTIDATYEMPGSGTSYFFAVSDQAIENSGVAFVEDGADSYIDYTMPADVEDQPILLMAKSEESDGSSFVINFAFKYILTPVALEASGDYYTIEEVTISNYYNSAKFSFKADDDGNLSTDNITYPTSKDGSYTIAPDPGVTSGAITNATSGWLMMPPQSAIDMELDITSYHYDNEVKDTSDTNGVRSVVIPSTIDNPTLEMGSSYTFSISTNQIVTEEPKDDVYYADDSNDFTDEKSANCYMLHPTSEEQVFYIPVEERINTFWGNNGYENVSTNTLSSSSSWTPSILWGDVVALGDLAVERVTSENFDGGADVYSALKVTLPASYNEGNVVIAVKNSAGTILWSWHLWITSYNPDEVGTKVNDYNRTVTGGNIHRYADATFLYSDYINLTSSVWDSSDYVYGSSYDVYMMDRNLGATDASASGYGSNYSGRGALYYQYGRKDPFPGGSDPLVGDTQPGVTSSATTYTMTQAVNNPTTFVKVSSTSTEWMAVNTSNSNYTGFDTFWRDIKTKTDLYYYYDKSTNYYQYILEDEKDTAKSIFDPSPLGWKIPCLVTWANWSTSNLTRTASYIEYLPNTVAAKCYAVGYMRGSTGEVYASYTNTTSDSAVLMWANCSWYNTYVYYMGNLFYNYYSYNRTGSTTTYQAAYFNRSSGVPIRPVRDVEY